MVSVVKYQANSNSNWSLRVTVPPSPKKEENPNQHSTAGETKAIGKGALVLSHTSPTIHQRRLNWPMKVLTHIQTTNTWSYKQRIKRGVAQKFHLHSQMEGPEWPGS